MSAVESLPAGFRFHPTDEELIVYYLSNRVASVPCPVRIVAEVDIYKFDPWDLPSRAMYGEKEWYFFSPRDRKYPNGARPNRAAGSGYWKATGTDKAILSSKTNKSVGVKKALVFYMGKPPKGVKSEWIMHEYRLTDNSSKSRNNSSGKQKHSMRLDDWVLCRIYKKSNSQTSDNSSSHEAPREEEEQSVTEDPNLNPLSFPYPNPYYAPVNSNITPDASFTLPKSSSLANLLESFDSIDHPSLSRLFDGSDLPGLELGFSSSTNQKLLNQQFVMSGGDDFETKDESFGGEVCQADQCSASKRLKIEKTGTRDCSQFNNFAAAGNHHLMNNQNLLFNYQFGLN